MTNSSRKYFVLWLWQRPIATAENENETENWLGCLESGDGERTYFKTLDELNQLIKMVGWQDFQGAKTE